MMRPFTKLLPEIELLLSYNGYHQSNIREVVVQYCLERIERGTGEKPGGRRMYGKNHNNGGRHVATRILLVDDDLQILPLLQRGLAYEGFEVYTAVDGEAGLAAAKQYQPHIVLLDITMPGLDGFEVCRRLRLQEDIAIIMLTARDEVTDKVSALNLGADDYVPKPFAFDELVARVRAVLRRHKAGGEPLVYADLELDQATREVRRAGQRIELTAQEYTLLLYFMRHPRQVLGREQILERVWGYHTEIESHVLEVYIGHLRQKLEAHGGARLIQTMRGYGYALRE
jgi:two-component system, OmpR family, response regulator MprA